MTPTLFAEIAAWSAATFPDATANSTMAHIHREWLELQDAVYGHQPTAEVGEECADMVLLLTQLCRLHGVDLGDAVAAKFATCQARTWQAPDASGVIEHVREATP